MNDTPSSNNKSGAGNNRRRRRPSANRSGNANGAKPAGAQQPAQNAANSNNPAKKSNSRSRRGGRNRKRSSGGGQSSNLPALQGMDLIRAKYLSLVEKHVEARRKYYDFFHRADPNQVRKLEREFTDTQAQLLAYENSLGASEREQLERDYGGRPEDRAYSSNHQISPEAQPVSTQGDFEDPHVLESQKRADFSQDTEESVGTIDDYKRLKGLI